MRDLRKSVKYLWADSYASMNLPMFSLRASQKPRVVAFCVFDFQRSDGLSENVDISNPIGIGDPDTVSLRVLHVRVAAAWI
jgi:hypothetical protein